MAISANMMTLDEVFKDINNDVTSLGGLCQYKPNSPLSQLFRAAFIEEEAWVLPEGDPPYKPYTGKNGTSPTDLLKAILRGRLAYFGRNKKVTSVKREELFIRLLETVHASEAKVLLAVKDQELTKLYPNITYEVLEQYGYLPHREVKKTELSKSTETTKPKPRRTVRPRKTVNPKTEVANETAAEE